MIFSSSSGQFFSYRRSGPSQTPSILHEPSVQPTDFSRLILPLIHSDFFAHPLDLGTARYKHTNIVSISWPWSKHQILGLGSPSIYEGKDSTQVCTADNLEELIKTKWRVSILLHSPPQLLQGMHTKANPTVRIFKSVVNIAKKRKSTPCLFLRRNFTIHLLKRWVIVPCFVQLL